MKRLPAAERTSAAELPAAAERENLLEEDFGSRASSSSRERNFLNWLPTSYQKLSHNASYGYSVLMSPVVSQTTEAVAMQDT